MIDPVTCDGLVGQGVWKPGDVQRKDVQEIDGNLGMCKKLMEQAQVKARLKAAATAACKKKQEAAEAQRRARAEAAQMANGVARKTRSGRLSQPVMTNNPDLRYLEPRRTRNSRMSW